jgi:hypothetical protein
MFFYILSNFNGPRSMFISSSRSASSGSHEYQLQVYIFLSVIFINVSIILPGSANYPVRLSTASMMIRFSTYSIFFGRVYSKEMNLDLFSGNGTANAGGTSWRKFV